MEGDYMKYSTAACHDHSNYIKTMTYNSKQKFSYLCCETGAKLTISCFVVKC